MTLGASTDRAAVRGLAAVVLATVVLVAAVLVGVAVLAGLLTLVGVVPRWTGGLLLVTILAGAALAAAWWSVRRVVPAVGRRDYVAPDPRWVRRQVLVAVVVAAVVAGGLASADGILAGVLWSVAVAGGGLLGLHLGSRELRP